MRGWLKFICLTSSVFVIACCSRDCCTSIPALQNSLILTEVVTPERGGQFLHRNSICLNISLKCPTGKFGITTPINGAPATHGNGSTIGFTVQSPEQGDAFHAAGVTTCEDLPGWRNGSVGRPYLAYLRDPDGNKICALHRPAKSG
jgi:catechol 2,3-dioxygenase-like lactoylglutathione lyase family enzyme